jgi:hypothetical protein
LTEDFIKDKGFLFPKVKFCDHFYDLYDSDLKKVESLSDNSLIIVVLSYNTSEDFLESYVSVAYSNSIIKKSTVMKGSLYYKYIKRMLDHASLKIIPNDIIEIYLEEDFYKFIDEENQDSVKLIAEFSQFQKIAFDCFRISNINTLRQNILDHEDIRLVLKDDFDYQIFGVYLYGLSQHKIYEEKTIVKFITDYIWGEIPLLDSGY